MNRRFKSFYLPLIVVALGAVSASAASAATFHSEVQTTYSYSPSTAMPTITTASGIMKCKKAVAYGQWTGSGAGLDWSTSSIALTPSFVECTMFGQAAFVDNGGCKYSLDAPGQQSAFNCPAGKAITISIPSANCSVVIYGQTGTSTVGFENGGVGSSRHVVANSKLSQVKYSVVGPGAFCGTPGTYEGKAGATLTSSFDLKGYKNAGHTEQVGVWTA